MKLFQVDYTAGLDPDQTSMGTEGTLYFGSHTQARTWGNQQVRAALAHWKTYHGISRLTDVGWEERLTISRIETAKIPTKALLLKLLNGEGGYCHCATVVEVWTPKDKWRPVDEFLSDATSDDGSGPAPRSSMGRPSRRRSAYLAERPHLTDDERNRDPESGYIVHSREALAATGWRDPHRKLHDACDEPSAPGCPDPLSCPTHREGYEA
jgi:hypothetical protein